MSNYYDPLFNKFKEDDLKESKKRNIEALAFNNIYEDPKNQPSPTYEYADTPSPMSGGKMVKAVVGDKLKGESIPVLVSVEDRICLPIEKD